VQPDLIAAAWLAGVMYLNGDFILGADNAIYECTNFIYCNSKYDTWDGALGWTKTEFLKSKLKSGVASTKPWYNSLKVDSTASKVYPWIVGDIVYHSDTKMNFCATGKAYDCRKNLPTTSSTANWTLLTGSVQQTVVPSLADAIDVKKGNKE